MVTKPVGYGFQFIVSLHKMFIYGTRLKKKCKEFCVGLFRLNPRSFLIINIKKEYSVNVLTLMYYNVDPSNTIDL